MKRIIVAIILMASFCVGANAQSLLDKAKGKVEKSVTKKLDQQVDKAIDGAVDRLFGGNGNSNSQNNNSSSSQSSSVGVGYSADGYEYAQELICENGGIWSWEGDEDSLPLLSGKTFKDAVGLMPEIPSASVLVTEKGYVEFDKTVKTAQKSTEAINTSVMSQMNTYTQGSQVSESGFIPNEKLEAIFEELVNMEEIESQRVSARQQAMVNNAFGALAGRQSLEDGTVDGALNTLAIKINTGWAKSEECRKVNQMEQALDAKLQDWMSKNRKGFNDSFPDWWTKGRQEQNAVIDSYNEKQMKKWIETIQRYEAQERPSVMRLVEIEEQLQNMSEAEKSHPYWSRSMMILTQLSFKFYNYVTLPSRVFSCPMVRHTAEESTI